MGGKPSKADNDDLAFLERRRRENASRNADELRIAGNNHIQQVSRMNSTLDAASRNVNDLQLQISENTKQNEKELRDWRKESQMRAEIRDDLRYEELEAIEKTLKDERCRFNEEHREKMSRSNAIHDADVRNSSKQMKKNEEHWNKEVRSSRTEQESIERKELEDSERHRKKMDQMAQNHQIAIEDEYEKMAATMEKQANDALERMAEENSRRRQLVDEDMVRMRRETISLIYTNLFQQFYSIKGRMQLVSDALGMVIMIINPSCNEFPFALTEFYQKFHTHSACGVQQIDYLRRETKLNFDVGDDFKKALLAPLEPFVKSADTVKNGSYQISLASAQNSMVSLKQLKKCLEAHQEVSKNTVLAMEKLDLTPFVENYLENNREAVQN